MIDAVLKDGYCPFSSKIIPENDFAGLIGDLDTAPGVMTPDPALPTQAATLSAPIQRLALYITAAAEVLAIGGFPDVRYISSALIPRYPGEIRRAWHQDWWGWDISDLDSYREIPPQVGVLIYSERTDSTRGGQLTVSPTSYRDICYGDEDGSRLQLGGEIPVGVSKGEGVVLDARKFHAARPLTESVEDTRYCLSMWFAVDWHNLSPDIQMTAAQFTPQSECAILGSLGARPTVAGRSRLYQIRKWIRRYDGIGKTGRDR